MSIINAIITCACAMLAISSASQAKGWRGIVPLHSTRGDVIRLLGLSPDANDLRSKYHLEKEEVYIVFSTKDFCDADAKKVPVGTVLLIQVTPKTETRLTDFQIDTKRLRKFDPSSPPGIGYEGYIDDEEGIIFRTYKGRVDEIAYIAMAKDKHLCPDYYASPEKFIQILAHSFNSKFDEYSNIPFNDEKARLDNFAAYLQQEPESKGYIIAYAGRRPHAGEAQARAERAKNYLIKERGVDAKRIVAIDGGHREELTVELYLVPRGVSAPTATPTVEPNKAQIIKAGNAKNKSRRSSRPRRQR